MINKKIKTIYYITAVLILFVLIILNESTVSLFAYSCTNKGNTNFKSQNSVDPGYTSKDEINTVYLTFDDGPSYVVTDAVLDVLKEKNVKATFFVVGKEIEGREKILKRICAEGHSIGLHTYSHNFKQIYRSEDIFIKEMEQTSEKVKEVTEYESNIIRFPGGSSGHLTKSKLDKIHNHNYKVYDWNVNLCDGVSPNLSVEKLVENSKKCKGGCCRRIILMHINYNNKNTVKALPKIIDYYTEQGYKFLPITDNTPEYYYRLKN